MSPFHGEKFVTCSYILTLADETSPPGSPKAAVIPSLISTPSPPPPSPPPSSLPPSSLPRFSLDKKRKHSAAFASTSEASTSTSPSILARKRHANGSSALFALSDQLSEFTDAFRAGTVAETGPFVASSPERKMMAMKRAQELESDLDDVWLVALIGLFQTDVSAADAYLVLKRDGLRKVWVESKLAAATCSSQL